MERKSLFFVTEMKFYIITIILIVLAYTTASPTTEKRNSSPLAGLIHGLKSIPDHFVAKVKNIISGLHTHEEYPFQNPYSEVKQH